VYCLTIAYISSSWCCFAWSRPMVSTRRTKSATWRQRRADPVLGGVWLRGLAGRGCGGPGPQVGGHPGGPAIHRGVGEKPTRGELARNPRYGWAAVADVGACDLEDLAQAGLRPCGAVGSWAGADDSCWLALKHAAAGWAGRPLNRVLELAGH